MDTRRSQGQNPRGEDQGQRGKGEEEKGREKVIREKENREDRSQGRWLGRAGKREKGRKENKNRRVRSG